MTLDAAKAVVIASRRRAAACQQRLNDAKTAWADAHADLLSEAAHAKTTLEDAEAALRDLALQHFAATQDKRPIAGVTIKEITRVEYDPAEALQWALTHRMCLQLNVKLFEHIAREALHPFVTWRKEPQAQLAKELDKETP